MTTFYFHVSKIARLKYEFDDSLFSINGNVIVINAQAARNLSEKINVKRREEGKLDKLVTAGQVNALGLFHELYHNFLRNYEEKNNPGVFKRTLDFLYDSLSQQDLDHLMISFIEEFPPVKVYKNEISSIDYLNSQTSFRSNREIIFEEIILLHLENLNPSIKPFKELFSDDSLSQKTRYNELIKITEIFFEGEATIGEGGVNLFSFLRKPIESNPNNIEEQLEYIRLNWGIALNEELVNRLLRGKDLISEDYKLFVQHGGGEKGTPPVPHYNFDQSYFDDLKIKFETGKSLSTEELKYYHSETEQFTKDIAWMPNVVMIAKNAFVWMFQLSQKYNRPIKKLDQIPDEELDQLADWNFNSLWLIGIWERSTASRKMKQMMGNPEATASAYSLYDYVISHELGGEASFQNLKYRADLRGIKLASDMVPNHSGIFSKWVVEKPDYFIQSNFPPYPGYRFTGPNLSDDNRVEIRIEDQYYSKTDAAVVFERLDRMSGDRKYIYHGNDGTNMPWNDTAQLNLMNPEVRESLIQTIMHVARKTKIIRFDAAMTLTKKHFQRLWFPIPGSGGDIPSRSDYSLTRSQFDNQMQEEFWREVVDRINSEMPDTLLLAEAFWLMEGYFVRTLGMHRVYNSAFMHMLMKEENDKYRLLIRNTISFNPEILKRYVNFMSNPDEETAVNQFGKGDKYFGVATLLITLPGLPMFAHGQVEGFAEKYGMEYYRSYYNEIVDDHLVTRHKNEIFPLIKKRYLFSEVDNFELYDFIDSENVVNENVYAFSNQSGNEFSLVLFNNSYYEASGRINFSNSKIKNGALASRSLVSAIGIKKDSLVYYSYKDFVNSKTYLVSGETIHNNGFHFHLNGYESKVLLDFRELFDFDGKYKNLCNYLDGRGVDSIEKALAELDLSPFHDSLINLLSNNQLENISSKIIDVDFVGDEILENKFMQSLRILEEIKFKDKENSSALVILNKDISILHKLQQVFITARKSKRKIKWLENASRYFDLTAKDDEFEDLNLILLFFILQNLFKGIAKTTDSNKIYYDLMLWKPLFKIFEQKAYYQDSESTYRLILALNNCNVIYNSWKTEEESNSSKNKKLKTKKNVVNETLLLNKLLDNKIISEFLLINPYEEKHFFNKERFEDLLKYFSVVAIVQELKKADKKLPIAEIKKSLKVKHELYLNSINLAKENQYCIENFITK